MTAVHSRRDGGAIAAHDGASAAGPDRLGVIVASAGRPGDVAMLLGTLASQSRPPDLVVLAVGDHADAPALPATKFTVEVLIAERGLTKQRNAGLAAADAAGCSVVAFFDDDFLPASDYLERAVAALAADPALLGVDGAVVADGAVGPGLTWAAAAEILAGDRSRPGPVIYDQPDGLYGCNMVVRTRAALAVRFDETLPLYAWLEDWDLSRGLIGRGRIGRVPQARGVHLGVKRGRTSGLRMGYSQIANPIHLLRKGTMPLGIAARHLLRRPAGNLWGALRRDPHVDRVGRLRGNLLGALDLARGRLHPARILSL